MILINFKKVYLNLGFFRPFEVKGKLGFYIHYKIGNRLRIYTKHIYGK